VPDILTFDQKNNHLCDIRSVVSNPLQVPRNKDQAKAT
jgi:hypothetical protein